MSDLISRSGLLKAMNTWDKFGCNEYGRLVRLDSANNEEYVPYVHYKDMVNCVKNMPTTYDIDKIVEELEELRDMYDDCIKNFAIRSIIEKAIEIVKQGDVGKDVSK